MGGDVSMRFAIGEIVVDAIVDDDDFELPLHEFLPGLDLAALGDHRGLLEPEFIDVGRNVLKCAIQTFVLRVAGRTVLIDACIGEHKDRPEIPAWHQRSGTGFLERLRGAGVDPAAVDTVFCTHLHIDHVGWNTRRADGRWVPTFPNARYLVGRAELDDWLARRDAGTAPAMHVQGLDDSVLPVVEAGLVDLVDDGHELAKGLALTALPGHTVGQMGLRIDRPAARAIFCGDAVHSPAQIVQPGLSTASCMDPRRAAETRRLLLEEAAASRRLVVPGHFRGWRRAYVREHGTAFAPLFQDELS
jgi:glyoxylase-like metal-dependent hydrolase (beta-lactamase superfamily II)